MEPTTRATTAVTERPGPGRRRADPSPRSAVLLRRWRNVCLVAAIGLITVAVPPLLIPDDRPAPGDESPPAAGPAGDAPSPSASPATGPAPSASTSASTSTAKPSASVTASPGASRPAAGAPACAASGGATNPPACAVYTSTLGAGWQVAVAGGNVFPAERVPGSDVVAIRVEPKEDGTSVWLTGSAAATVPGTLRFRVYGGRVNGTVARVSLSSTPAADRSRSVLVNAPADVWTEFSFPVADLLPAGSRTVQRIDFTIVDDAVPAAYRFFIDDIAFA